uniref:Uncharacterized protein n=2 Tax=Ixodes scapularis TaxID=6945 RepID=A0A1S4LD53_IXOSC
RQLRLQRDRGSELEMTSRETDEGRQPRKLDAKQAKMSRETDEKRRPRLQEKRDTELAK